ncbi:WASH complex subunit 2 isoform X2 [Bombus terrestris]|uniref:WASH complex subunit 2 isoform X2 n=1 Tax=Bombus terrestris TaxID=30195 RepID=A0A9C6SQK3_BOMTE|nr:WASH complex subunit 2 isoform X2 [Bombus terrestris]
MDISNGMDKSWDHPWTTDEMRKKRREWSLAGDAGLLKHLQQFSNNVVSRANKTQEALDSLTTQLNETAIFIDNVTNTSLALANTQFIESRVQEDNIEIGQQAETLVKQGKDEDSATADFIASVSESVKQGLNIMYEKYKEMEFVDSDSEEEDNKVVLSVVLGPNNPYQDRPLPYVIGSEKWKNSNKIGLESSSSSESEQVDEEEESESEDDTTAAFKDYSMNAAPKTNIVGLLPSLNESDYSKRNDMTYIIGNDKMDALSQNEIDSVPDSVTPADNTSKIPLPNNITPNFAEELAKRLGTVRQTEKPVVDEKNEASINRFKDDLFTPEEDENILNDKSKTIISRSKGFLNDQFAENASKERQIKSYKNNIIPASIDVPPPISTVSTKPKSAIDDLFGDADSDIFSPKNTVTKNKYSSNNNQSAKTEGTRKNHLEIASSVTSNMTTSTPETNVNTNLFSDDEDVGDLFGSSKHQQLNKKKPGGEVSIFGNILTSEIESKLSRRISRTQSSGSSGSNTPANYEISASNESALDRSRNVILNNNINEQDSIVTARNNAENSNLVNESSYSSGISIHPSSINNTGGSSIGVDFQPQMTSTRLKSEEIYREQITSDSLFTARTQNPANATSILNSTNNQPQEESIEDVLSIAQDDVFENEDLFGPPPLPKADSKPAKSKMPSLFDDSDSGDELFSTTSSGSRSQRSSDLLTSQYSDKIKSTQRRGLFDEEIDIFDNKDSLDVDIFGIIPKPVAKQESSTSGRKFLDIPDDDLFASNIRDTIPRNNGLEKSKNVATSKEIRLFDDDDIEDGDLFATKPVKSETKNEPDIFNDDDENDLFSAQKPIDKKQKDNKQPSETAAFGIDITDQKVSTEKNKSKSSDILSGNGLFSTAIGSHGLIFEDDDYDDLFSTKNVSTEKTKEDAHLNLKTTEDTKEHSIKNIEISNSSDIFVKSEESNVPVTASTDIEQDNDKDMHRVSSSDEREPMQNSENELKKSPPKSLDIHTSATLSSPEKNNQAAKRVVSGKIKNLMGRMGDLKLISPMDTPPVWRKSKEKADEEDSAADRDSDDGGCLSTQGPNSPLSVSEDSTTQKQSQQSMISDENNAENAISFDEPAQLETLSTTASKTRVRIQARRRPQSRQARKSAIRQSGIDFDTVDFVENNSQDENQVNQSSSIFNKETLTVGNISAAHTTAAISDHLVSSTNDNVYRAPDTNIFLAADDKSELGSISKESSVSANKNTLLSPSTDEEDLFDVPPDLPEDPQKEDTLFGRAPILSPVEKVVSEKPPVTFKVLKDTHIKQIDDIKTETGKTEQQEEKSSTLSESSTTSNVNAAISCAIKKESKSEDTKFEDESKKMIDPLRDDSHDPLKDPSQLFAFVTKTPSPEKGKNLLFSEDDSLFSSGNKKFIEEKTTKKPILDLFTDDAESDLFSTTLTKAVKKPLKDTKISLFDEEDEDDSLFGSVVKKSTIENIPEKRHSMEQTAKKISLFGNDDNDTNLFSEPFDQTQKSDSGSIQEQSSKNDMLTNITETVRTSHITDIFADQSSGEDDIFAKTSASKKTTVTSKSLFPSDDDDDDDNIFGKKFTSESQVNSAETRSIVKKAVTRDLKKTAEKIGEDPLSALLDD